MAYRGALQHVTRHVVAGLPQSVLQPLDRVRRHADIGQSQHWRVHDLLQAVVAQAEVGRGGDDALCVAGRHGAQGVDDVVSVVRERLGHLSSEPVIV